MRAWSGTLGANYKKNRKCTLMLQITRAMTQKISQIDDTDKQQCIQHLKKEEGPRRKECMQTIPLPLEVERLFLTDPRLEQKAQSKAV